MEFRRIRKRKFTKDENFLGKFMLKTVFCGIYKDAVDSERIMKIIIIKKN